MSWFICLLKGHLWMPSKQYKSGGDVCARCGQWEYEP
jgi:hypothetical protein